MSGTSASSAELPVIPPARCDAELLADLFDLPPHQRAVVIAGTASEHINAKLDLIRQFRVSAEGMALLTIVGGQVFPQPATEVRRFTVMEPVEAGGCAPPILASYADALADQGREA